VTAARALSDRWRADAARLRELGYEDAARHSEKYADELDAFVAEWELEELDLETAAAESGYSYSALQKRVRRGDIANAGSSGRPRIRRRDLPRKGGRSSRSPGQPDLAARVMHDIEVGEEELPQ
jgi:hypothetical protein